jgi:hypothetical protein
MVHKISSGRGCLLAADWRVEGIIDSSHCFESREVRQDRHPTVAFTFEKSSPPEEAHRGVTLVLEIGIYKES